VFGGRVSCGIGRNAFSLFLLTSGLRHFWL
jgi:hypothetical protein